MSAAAAARPKSGEDAPAYARGSLIRRRYRVYRHVSGGIGDVYFCLDEKSGLPLAIKCLKEKYVNRPDKYASLRRRFNAEALIWAGVERHPNIVRCHYLTEDGGRPLLCMEWVTDPNRRDVGLGRLIRVRGRLPLQDALGIAIGACRGLLHLQERYQGFVHRDLKPENILIAGAGTPKVTDFGFSLLRADQRRQASSAVSDSSIVGTPHYMAPEQWRTGLVDDRADVYAMGLILYEMLDGKRPFAAKERAEWRHAHRHEPPRPIAKDVAPAAQDLVARCLEKDPAARYASMADLHGALCRLYEAEIGAPLPPGEARAESTAQDYNNRGNTHYHLGLLEEAAEAYASAILADPCLAYAHAGLGLVLHSLGRFEESLAAYDAALELAPGMANAHANRAALHNALGEQEAALAGYTRALEIDPTLGQAAVNRGVLRLAAGDRPGAMADFTSAIAAGGTREAFVNRAEVFASDGDLLAATRDLETLAALEPLTFEEEQRLADWLTSSGRFRDAVAALTRALAIGGPAADLHRQRAGAYARAGRTSDALEDLGVAILLDPANGESFRQRAALYRDQGRYDEALADYGRAVLKDEGDPRPYFEMALVLGYRGEVEKASQLLTAAAERGSVEAQRAQQALEARLRAMNGLALTGRRQR